MTNAKIAITVVLIILYIALWGIAGTLITIVAVQCLLHNWSGIWVVVTFAIFVVLIGTVTAKLVGRVMRLWGKE